MDLVVRSEWLAALLGKVFVAYEKEETALAGRGSARETKEDRTVERLISIGGVEDKAAFLSTERSNAQ